MSKDNIITTLKMSSNCCWTSKDDEVLINFVRNHEVLYNIKSKDYRKSELKQKRWREIGTVLNKTDSDCSKRWCYIRDYYVRRRAKPGTTSGEAAQKRADLLSFLDSLPLTQAAHKNDPNWTGLVETSPITSPVTQRGSTTNIVEENSGNNSVVDKSYDSEQTQTNKKRSSSQSNEPESNEDNETYGERLNLLKQIANKNILDENDLFFGSMAKIVKKLPAYEQIQLRLQIGSLVGNAELRHISNNSPQYSNMHEELKLEIYN